VPSRKEIQWSQLRVGALVLTALAVLIGLIFLISGSTGGLFSKTLRLRAYFANAAGLKNGAPVTLQGVTIGNVVRMNIVSGHNPDPVEVIMQVGLSSAGGIHTDSTATIAQAGVLGDSYVDIDSTHATGPNPPPNNTVLKASGAPTVQDVIQTSQQSIEHVQALTIKLETLVDSLNSKKGLVGELINDPEMTKKVLSIATNLQTVTDALSSGKGTLGKLTTDDTLYQHALTAVDRLDQITASLQEGKGTAGKLLKDDALYNNLNAAVANTRELVAGVNAGHGAMGKVMKDPAFAKKLDDTVTNLDSILNKVNQGQGTLGQLVQNRTLYDHADQSLDQMQQLLQEFRANPKKYLQIRMRVF
jgi:phospholipid/cholesterol/gamma-HCH transport system substrate-binding protein